jgi:hypothetical protein
VIGIIFAIGCRSPFLGSALACEAKANLHPLAFYTIEFTSPVYTHSVVVGEGSGYHSLTFKKENRRRKLALSPVHENNRQPAYPGQSRRNVLPQQAAKLKQPLWSQDALGNDGS